ncbi:universal stress protein [Knoellia subterranea]|uniref:Universal stress protein n=1 Tax=Knoellia subterranea KCTC 19937 TaxID=1385521 RepID=A0A0A0JSW5_9MICO|nr:universal stress protein [Knoellia subterranea]KGN38731.1 universal stress protein [Knoellia subterranea KCTC 19937]
MTIVVGFRGGADDRSGLELAVTLARSSQIPLEVVAVVPASWPTPVMGAADRDFSRWAAEQGAAAVAEADQLVAEIASDLTTTTRSVAARSVATGLLEVAARDDVAMLVIGSSAEAGHGQVNLGSTANRLLHSSPVPVALAPRGHQQPAGSRVGRATCAFRGDDSSRSTLERTARICREVGASLRLATFAVRGRTMYPPEVGFDAEDEVLRSWVDQAVTAQERALEALGEADILPDDVTTVVGAGRTWAGALDAIGWERDDVLVVGSTRENLVERIFLGSSATKIVRHAPVPVIVVP